LLVIASRAVLRSFTAALDRVIPNSTSLDEALAETPAAAAQPARPDPPGTDP
jgi:hypothetical protein